MPVRMLSDVPNVLELPSVYNTPTRGEILRGLSGSGDCDCNKSGNQRPGNWPNQQPNPYQLSAPPLLGQPPMPQKPFQPVDNTPCQATEEALKGLGIDPNCMMKSPAKRKSTNKPKLRQYKTLTQKRLFPAATSSKKKAKAKRPPGSLGYRILKNGACFDNATRKFVKKSKCQ